LRMESLLYKAIDANQFVLFYQPKTDVHTGEVKGVEALIRWNSPELGMVSPLEFIPIVERGGMMPQVTEWVIGEACRQLQQWQPLDLKNIRVAINASPVDLRDQNFAAKLLAQLGGYDIPTKSLEVEITETGVMENMKTAIKSLRELQENGVTLSLDDFGTGHSSLSHLNALPLNVLKIDGCFVRDIHINPSNEAIVRAIVAMANTAGLTILAEGVETAEELLVLRNLGVDEIQGFVVSRPLSAEDVTEFILTTNAEFEASRHNRKHGRVIDLLPRWLSARG
ncbi:MAG: EAL domain-containing protein, partial [Gammaproteobacteria bacterium]|nr:EAL domain-containing protein [Gammaproteobacteria bacterium]